jgi:uncharacterized protein YaaQ
MCLFIQKHKNAKIKCNLNENEVKIKKLELKIKMLEIESLKTKNTCKFCNSEYSYLNSLQKHLKESCKSKHRLLQQRQLLLKNKK